MRKFPLFDMDFFRTALVFMTVRLHSATGELYEAIPGCKRNYALVSSLSQRLRTRSVSECAVLCSGSTLPCASFNACENPASQSSSSEREIECELLTSVTGGNCSLLQSDPGCSYKEKRIPCVNGTVNITDAKCVCLPGFAGQACDRYYRDCHEAKGYGTTTFVNWLLQPLEAPKPFLAQCHSGHGYTTILRRLASCSAAVNIFTTATWNQLQDTLGECQCHCFIGLRNLYYLLKPGIYTLKIIINYASYSRAADRYYQNFTVGDESTNYTVSYTSTAADVPSPSTAGHGFAPGGQWRFCTQDRDCSGCAQATGFPGWFDMAALPTCVPVFAFGTSLQWSINGAMTTYNQLAFEVFRP